MNHLLLGHNGSGKTSAIKKMLQKENYKVVVLDYNDAYDDISEDKILLDNINPLLSPIGVDESKALNAGYVHNSMCLYNQCKSLLKEYKGENDDLNDFRRTGLIEEALIRMQVSWDNVETAYAKILSSRIPNKVSKRHISAEDAIATILGNQTTLLKMKNMYSDHLRAVTFMLLSKLSKATDEKIIIVADDQSSLFNQGNIKLLLETVDEEMFDFYLAFNKASNAPKNFLPSIDRIHLLRFENNSEVKLLHKLHIVDDVPKNLKTLKTGKLCSFPNLKKTNTETKV